MATITVPKTPGASSIDAYEARLNQEIQAWATGNRGITDATANQMVQQGMVGINEAKQIATQEALKGAQRRGITQSSILDSTNANIYKNYMQNVENLNRDIQIQKALSNIQAAQFGISSGLQSSGMKRDSMMGGAQLGLQGSIANADLAEKIRQYNATLANNKDQFGQSLSLDKAKLGMQQNAQDFEQASYLAKLGYGVPGSVYGNNPGLVAGGYATNGSSGGGSPLTATKNTPSYTVLSGMGVTNPITYYGAGSPGGSSYTWGGMGNSPMPSATSFNNPNNPYRF